MSHQMRSLAAIIALVAIAPLASCGDRAKEAKGANDGAAAAVANPWDTFVGNFLNGWFEANPGFAVYQGRHDFDGRMPDWSEAGLGSEVARLERLADSARTFVIAEADSARRFERDYLLQVIDGELFWRQAADAPHKNPAWYADRLDPNVYLTREYAALEQRLKGYTAWARAVPASVAAMRANLQTPMPRALAEAGRLRIGGLASYLRDDVPSVFAAVTDSTLLREFLVANDSAAAALAAAETWFGSEAKRGTRAFALGPQLFQDMVRRTEGVDVSLETLEQVAQADLARNLAALDSACALFAPGAAVETCVRRVSAHKPPEGPVAGATRQLRELENFVRARDLVSIPGTEKALVRESPPHMRWNFAYIDIPGPYERNLPSIYYIAPPDPAWSPADRDAYVPSEVDLLYTSVHEVWPGHFLQFLHANRARSAFGRVFVGYAFAEGWAHYAEEMMWDAGLGDGSPESHIGQLLNALLRNARMVAAIGMHARGMRLSEAEQVFRRAHISPPEARQQAARGTFDPAYLNYTMGKLMIRKLRDDWVASRGGRSAWKEFHNAFLAFGGPPIPQVRRAMLGANAGPAL